MRKFLFVAALSLWVGSAFAQSLTASPPINTQPRPAYPASRFYAMGEEYVIANTSAFPVLDTVILLYPFWVNNPITSATLNVRTVTAVASCAIKLVIFANDPLVGRATGTPIAGSNTGQACTSSGSTASIASIVTLYPGNIYWAGFAVTTGNTMFMGLTATGAAMTSMLGRSAMTNALSGGLSAPYAYATDITALNLTGATFTDVVVAGIPLLYIGN